MTMRLCCLLFGITAMAGLAAQEESQPPPDPLRALFEQSQRDGIMSSAALDLRRQPDVVAYLQRVLDEDVPEPEKYLALQHIMRIGPAAEPAVPSVLRILDGSIDRARFAAITLAEIGPFVASETTRAAILDRLVKRCAREPPTAPFHSIVARAWWRVQTPVATDVPTLIAELESGNPFRIELGIQRLLGAGAEAQAAVPLALKIMQLPGTFLPQDDVARLRGLGIHARTNWTLEVRESLFAFFTFVAPSEPGALPLYLQRLQTATGEEKVQLLRRIGHVGAGSRDAAVALVPFVQSQVPLVAREAVTALGMVGPAAAVARPVLESLQSSADAQLAARASAALKQIGPGK